MIEIIKAKTDKQYSEMGHWVGQYTNHNMKKIEGKLKFISGSEKIYFSRTKEVIIDGENQKNINEIKKYLEHIVQTERRSF